MSLGNALGYLTLLPVPHKKSVPFLRSIHYFPLVGAGLGSLAVLFFLLISEYFSFPNALACFLTVIGLELLYGGTPLRGLAEMAQGQVTHLGQGFDSGFKLHARGAAWAVIVIFVKGISLMLMPREWQTHAVFVLPILGRCSQTLSFVLSPHDLSKSFRTDKLIAQRRVRAGLWSLMLLFVFFLFPLRVAFSALALFALIQAGGLRRCNARFKGLTLQTVSMLAELSETAVLILLAVSARLLGLK